MTNTNENAAVVAAPVSKGRGNPTAIKYGAITFKSIRAASNFVAKKTGENPKLVYSRVYQRVKAGHPVSEALRAAPLKKGKAGMTVTIGAKTFNSLMDALKHKFKKATAEELSVLYTRTLARMKSGLSFDEAIVSRDLRGKANCNEITVNEVTYPSLIDAIRALYTGLTTKNQAAVYNRFSTGLKSGKSFMEILETPVRVYQKSNTPLSAQESVEALLEMYPDADEDVDNSAAA